MANVRADRLDRKPFHCQGVIMKRQKLEKALSRHFAAMHEKAAESERGRMKSHFRQSLFFRNGRLITVTTKGVIFYQFVSGQFNQHTTRRG